MSKLSQQGAASLRRGLEQIENDDYVKAIVSMDQLQSSDPNTWEACFYPGYAGVMEAAYKFGQEPTRIGSVVSLLMETLTKQVVVLQPRIAKVVDHVFKDEKDDASREQALSEIVSRARAMIDAGGMVLKETFKFRKEFRDGLNDGGIIDGIKSAIENSSEKSDFRALCSAVSALGYTLGDEIEKHCGGEMSDFYKGILVGVWQQSTTIDYEFDPDGDVRTKYIEKIKAINPEAKVGGETRELMKKIQAVVVLILVAIGAFYFFDVPGRIGEFFSSFGDTSDEAVVEKFAAATSGRFTVKGEVLGWDNKWFGDDEIYLSVQNSKRKLRVVCKIDKLPTLKEGQWLSVRGKKTEGGALEVIECSPYKPTGKEPKYSEHKPEKIAPVPQATKTEVVLPVAVPVKESSEADSVVTSTNIGQPVNEVESIPTVAMTASDKSEDGSRDVSDADASSRSGDSSLDTFRKYVAEMNDASHEKSWHEKYQGQSLTLRAKMKKVKVKKNETIVECSVDGENVVVYMQRQQADKALAISKGDFFTVRGNIAKKRFGILHTMGLSEGEIIN